eukprot:9498321-Pyramimonas_sp.AAC.1
MTSKERRDLMFIMSATVVSGAGADARDFSWRALEDRSARCALEIDHRSNRRADISVLLLSVQAKLGEFPCCEWAEFV